jgi:MYXO-CTERM domain-containing protein
MALVQNGDGEVVITELPGATPAAEPASLATFAGGLIALAAIRRRRGPPR